MNNTKVQTPVNVEVLEKARKRAEEVGFNSINDVIRIMLKQFGEGNLDFSVTTRNSQNSIPYVSDAEQAELTEIIKNNKENGLAKIVKSEVIEL